jgi:hypothetical protein
MPDMPQESSSDRETVLASSGNLTDCKSVLREMIAALNAGPRTRNRALAITALQEAVHWIVDAQAEE